MTMFICIIWTQAIVADGAGGSWGLSLFVLFGVFSGKNPYGSS